MHFNIRTKYSLLLAMLLLLVNYANGQQQTKGSIKGNILLDNGNQNLAGATVRLIGITDTTFKNLAISDTTGNFKFNNLPYGSYLLKVSYIGFPDFLSKQITVDAKLPNQTLAPINLDNTSNQLKEVVVVSEKPHFEKEIDRLVVNISSSIGNAGTNAIDILNNSPGIMVEENGGISLNGKNGALILIDDKPTYLSGRDLAAYLRSLPSGSLDKIEIISNPPARYRAAGSAGIINIKTKKIKTPGLNGNLSSSFGHGKYAKSYNSLILNNRINKFNFYGSAGYSLTDNYYDVYRTRQYNFQKTATDYTLFQNNFETNRKKNTSYKLGVDYDPNKNTSIGLMYHGFTSPYKESGFYNNQFVNPITGIDSILNAQSQLLTHSANNTLNLNLLHRFNKSSGEFSFNLDYLNYKIRSNQITESNTYFSDNSFKNKHIQLSNNPYHTNIYSAQADYGRKIWGNAKLESGFQYLYSFRDNNGEYYDQIGNQVTPNNNLNNSFNYTENINALYLNFRKSISRITFQTGLRMENTRASALQTSMAAASSSFKLNYSNLFPTLFLSYKLDSNSAQVVDFSIGRRISRPDYQSLNPSIFFFDKNTSNRGNPLLRPDFSTNFEVNYTYGGTLTAGLFYSRTRDKITSIYKQIDNTFMLIPSNIDRLKSIGLKSSLSLSPINWLKINWYGELVNNDYKGWVLNDEYLDNSYTSFQTSGNMNFKLAQNWNFEISGLYRGARILGQGIYKPICQIHAGLQKSIFKNKGFISLNARDLFHSWTINREMLIKYVNVYSSNINDTRQTSLSFSYRFGKSANNRVRKNAIQSEAKRAGAN